MIFPAIVLAVMLMNREVVRIHERTRFLIGHTIFRSKDKTTSAQILALGVVFSTSFRSGLVLISCNYGNHYLTWENYVRHAISRKA